MPPLLVAYLRGLSPLPEERRLDALPGDVGSGAPRPLRLPTRCTRLLTFCMLWLRSDFGFNRRTPRHLPSAAPASHLFDASLPSRQHLPGSSTLLP